MKKHSHAIIVIKNDNNFLQYYDKRWNSYLFLNCKIENQSNIDKIKEYIMNSLNTKNVNIKYVMDKIHTKFSESSKIEKTYHHYFFEATINNIFINTNDKEFNINGIKYRWFSIDELKNDKRIQKVNSDIVQYVLENENIRN